MLFPTLGSYADVNALHGDAIFYGAYQPAKIAADAFVRVHFRNADRRRDVRAIACVLFDVRYCDAFSACGDQIFGILKAFNVNALMRAIPACDVAQIAADAFIGMNARDDFVIQIQTLPFRYIWQAASAKNRQSWRILFPSIQLLRPSIMSSTMRNP